MEEEDLGTADWGCLAWPLR